MKNAYLILLFGSLLIFSGCTQQAPTYICPNGDQVQNPEHCTKYVCSNGTVVYESSLCRTETQPPAQNQNPPVETNRECSPPRINPYCEESTLNTNFTCVNGNWEYDTKFCEWGCTNGTCVIPTCHPCDDGLVCTEDFCSPETGYTCKHVLVTNENCTINGTRVCVPRPLSGSYVRLDVFPYGTSTDIMSNMIATGEKEIGQELEVAGTRLRVDNFYLNAQCVVCGEEPRTLPTEFQKVRITSIKEGLAINQTFENKRGDAQFFCVEGECKNESHGVCIDFECTERMKYVVRELIITWNCS